MTTASLGDSQVLENFRPSCQSQASHQAEVVTPIENLSLLVQAHVVEFTPFQSKLQNMCHNKAYT
jgi:DNA primase